MNKVIFEKDYTQEDIDNGNTVPYYGVSWDNPRNPAKRTGNSWTSKEKAISVYLKKAAAGLNPKGRESRIAGFI